MKHQSLSSKVRDLCYYLRDFGWITILFIGVNALFLLIWPQYYSRILVTLLLLALIAMMASDRRKLLPVYVLVGRTISITGIITSFLLIQIGFCLIYESYLNMLGCDYDILELLAHTVNSAISMDSGQITEFYFENQPFRKDVYRINTVQLIFSWLYLGLLISSLYQRLKHQ